MKGFEHGKNGDTMGYDGLLEVSIAKKGVPSTGWFIMKNHQCMIWGTPILGNPHMRGELRDTKWEFLGHGKSSKPSFVKCQSRSHKKHPNYPGSC
jgi:hypothetical protein